MTDTPHRDRPAVCLVGGARYSRPLDPTSARKFAALSAVARLHVIGFSVDAKPRRFREHAEFYLLPCLPGAPIRYALMAVFGTLLVVWCAVRHGVVVVMAQSPYEGASGALGKMIARVLVRRLSLVVESHGDFENDLFLQRRMRYPHIYRMLMRGAARLAFARCDAVRAVSVTTRTQLEARAPGRPCVQFPAWTDFEAFSDAGARCSHKVSGEFLYAGVLIPRKGVHVLLAALGRLTGAHPELSLRIVGEAMDASYADRLRALADAAPLRGRVVFQGPEPQRELARHMTQSDALVVPSLSEGLGRVVLEAMACGTTVLASDVGGIPDMIQDGKTGLLVPPGDAAALADRMEWILEHPNESSRIAEAGRAFALQFFSTAKYVAAFARLVDIAMGSPQKHLLTSAGV